jgi:uncharacterized protein YllA (UPF0747 family)
MRVAYRDVPASSALFLDYLSCSSRVKLFYSKDYSLDAIQRFARERPVLPSDHRHRLCSVLREQQKSWSGTQRGVDKLAAGAVAVVTGQQPMLFSGPHFSVLKTLTVIRIAKELERAGIPAVPAFWLAAEDHDYQEIQTTWVLNRTSGLSRISVDLSNSEALPAGAMRFGADIEAAVSHSFAELPQTEFCAEFEVLLRSCYEPGVSPVTAFARLMARLFEGSDLVLVDALQPDLKHLAQPVMDAAIRRNRELRSALIARSRAIAEAGYHEQVKVDENFTGLFAYQGRSRRPVRPAEVTDGMAWSPNVLLRPVVQDFILPTAAYIGGPAEVAYFAQAGAAYEVLEVPMPPVFPRLSATLVEPRVARALEKYGFELSEVFRGRDLIRRRAVQAVEDAKGFDRVRAVIEAEMESLRGALRTIDPTLEGALDTSRQKMLHQMETLKGKFVTAVARRDETLDRHLDTILNSLYPEKKLQERVINILSFLTRYGFGLLPQLETKLSLDTTAHQVLEI